MIIVRSPLRITLGGGGTDLPSYYRQHSGLTLSAAIDKYVYIIVQDSFNEETILKYSEMEVVSDIDQIKHPIFFEALKSVFRGRPPHLEIISVADIPKGTGLGSSGAFTVALLKALHLRKDKLYGNMLFQKDLAEAACKIEIDKLKNPVGKQDQYASVFGNILCFDFLPDDSVSINPLSLSRSTLSKLEDNLLLFFTGYAKESYSILQDQVSKTLAGNLDMVNNLHHIKALATWSRDALESGDLERFAIIMNEHWEHKRQRSRGMTNPDVDNWYNIGIKNGAIGGKLIGAGGRGLLMFYAKDCEELRRAMKKEKLKEIPFKFDFEGTKVISCD